jgi:hypothetical protein
MLHLDQTIGGAGSLRADLTPGCAAALSAVLDALSGRAGPEDTRSFAQRRHDALEEAWGWTLTCHPDGTTTATAPDGRTLHSHSPPTQTA